MKPFFIIMIFVAFSTVRAAEFDYPQTKRSDQTDNYFGTIVADPYRWLEDENAPDVAQWVAEENQLTEDYLAQIPFRAELQAEIKKRFDYEKRSLPFKKKDRYFYFKNSGLQNQPVLYMTSELAKEPTPLLDLNRLSNDGTVALAAYAVSKNGRYLAYSVSRSGSDWQEAFVLDIESGKLLDDHLKWLKFSDLAWAGDGFYYCRFPEPAEGKDLSAKNEFHQVWFHRVGTDQTNDRLIYVDQDHPQRNCSATVDEEEQFLFLSESESTYGNRLLYRDLLHPESEFTVLFPTFDAETFLLDVHNGQFYFLTDYKAPKRRIVAVDPADPNPERWRDVIPESEFLLSDAIVTGDKIAATYLKDAAEETTLYQLDGTPSGTIPLPTFGVTSLSGKKGDSELFYSFTSFVYPTSVYRFDIQSGETTPIFQTNLNLNPDDYVTERLWFTSPDGTRAPIFVTYKKGLVRDGSNPTLLYGYGGFNVNMTPSFKPERTVFLDHGGVLAVAVLRGGGEYGAKWHEAGTKLQKQNVFDDFIAAAEFLIAKKFTSSDHLAIHGGSNGGLLVGAVMTQRPDLFKVAVPAVGVLDMLRYHKFTIGWAWAADYGTSEENREMFDALYRYSPLHNVKSGVCYPATLILTSDHDDRVVPGHSFKFAATLQNALTKNDDAREPALIRIETKAGHGRGKPISKLIDENTDVYSFILFNIQ